MRRIVAIAIPVASSLLLLAAGWAEQVAGKSFLGTMLWLPLVAACTGVGALLWYRRVGGVLGLLFIATGAFVVASTVLGGYADLARVRALPAGDWAAWAFQWSLGGAFVLFLILQLFPTGRPLSPRWRPLVWLTIVAGVASGIGPALGPTTDFARNFPAATHPVNALPTSTADVLSNIAGLLVTVSFLASAVSMVIRYRRSVGEERAQMKWFAAAAVVAAVGFVIGLVTLHDDPAIAFAVLAPLIPIAAGIAIVKYRLYDIDVVISKTLVVALLAVFISVVYVAIVVGLGVLVPDGELALSIGATAVVALLFQSARDRAQTLANRLVFGARATPYEVMAGFATRMADSLSIDEVLPQMAEAAGRGVGATHASVRVLLPNGERLETWPTDDAVERDATTFPVVYHGEDVGEIGVEKPRGEPLTHAEEELLRDLAGQAGLALHNVRLNEELAIRLIELDEQAAALRLSRERLVTARDAQRRGLQRDIHEGPEHELRLIRQRLDTVEALAARDPAAAGTELDALGERSNATLDTLRDLARGIFPPLLADQGIVPALEAHIRKVGAGAIVAAQEGFAARRFDADIEACVYFCCLQAIQNVVRHAGKASAVVSLGVDEGGLWCTIQDDGTGYDPATIERGMGLDIMQDRVDALDGSLLTTSARGAGTTVRIHLPLAPARIS